MAAAAVMRPSSHSSVGRQATSLGHFRPRSARRTGHAEVPPVATATQRRLSEKRVQAPAQKKNLPEARSASRSAPSGLSRSSATATAAAAATLPVGGSGSVASALQRRAPSSAASALLAASTGRNAGAASRTVDSNPRPPQERRKSAASIRAGMMVATSSKSLGNSSNNSSSPRSSNVGAEASEAASTQKLQVPAGAEEDFEPYNWLSDASIAFASSCLASSGGSTNSLAERHAFPKSIVFMDPAMVFWLTMQEGSSYLDEAKKEMKLHEIDLLLCPISDAHAASYADAGCHWSLLACWSDCLGSSRRSRGSGELRGPLSHFRYYDSLGGLFAEKGMAQASELAQRLAGKPVHIEIGECAQQTNFYDCGVYVLLFEEIIAKAFVESRKRATLARASPPEWEERLLATTPEEVVACRAHYHDLAREGSE